MLRQYFRQLGNHERTVSGQLARYLDCGNRYRIHTTAKTNNVVIATAPSNINPNNQRLIAESGWRSLLMLRIPFQNQ
jgi:hypothetical protein